MYRKPGSEKLAIVSADKTSAAERKMLPQILFLFKSLAFKRQRIVRIVRHTFFPWVVTCWRWEQTDSLCCQLSDDSSARCVALFIKRAQENVLLAKYGNTPVVESEKFVWVKGDQRKRAGWRAPRCVFSLQHEVFGQALMKTFWTFKRSTWEKIQAVVSLRQHFSQACSSTAI